MRRFVWLPLLFSACGFSTRDLRVAEDRRERDSVELREGLRGPEASIRSRAALAMGRIQSYLPDLVRRLGEENDTLVRRAILFAIGQCALSEDWKEGDEQGADDAAAAFLKDTDPTTRQLAVETLGKLRGPKAVERLTPLLRDPTPEVRGEAAIAIFRYRFRAKPFAPIPPETLTALIAAAGDDDPEVRWRAAYALTRFGDAGAIPAAVKLSNDAHPWCRLFAVRALARMKGEGVIEALKVALRDPEPMIRAEAVGALALQQAWKSIPAALAKDASWHVRAAVARALASPDSEGDPAALMKDESLTVRCDALASWIQRGGDPTGPIRDPHWKVRKTAARHCKTEAHAGEALSDFDVRVRAAALEALAEQKGPHAEKWIVAALDDPDVSVRGTAVESLPAVKAPLFAYEKAYRGSLERKYIELRETLAASLAEVEGSTDLLREILKDPEASVRSKARKALRAKGVDAGADEPVSIKISPFLDQRFERKPTIVFETDRGTFELECFADHAPIHVASLVHLVEQNFFDGLIFHRVVSNFVVQGGDPTGTGWGDAGYNLRDEISRARFDRGAVGMPKAGKDTGGCQIFITHTPTPHLDGSYTVFGRVVRGMDVVDVMEEGDRILRARVRR